jgi:hypothetical protein
MSGIHLQIIASTSPLLASPNVPLFAANSSPPEIFKFKKDG